MPERLRTPPGLLPSFPALELRADGEAVTVYAPGPWKPLLALVVGTLGTWLLVTTPLRGPDGEPSAMVVLTAAVLILAGAWLLLVRSGLVIDRSRGVLEAYLGYHAVAPLTRTWPFAEVAEVTLEPRAVKPLMAPEASLTVVTLALRSGEAVELIALSDAAEAEALAGRIRAALPASG